MRWLRKLARIDGGSHTADGSCAPTAASRVRTSDVASPPCTPSETCSIGDELSDPTLLIENYRLQARQALFVRLVMTMAIGIAPELMADDERALLDAVLDDRELPC